MSTKREGMEKRILVVDDIPEIGEAIAGKLRLRGFDARAFTHGRDAVAAVQAEPLAWSGALLDLRLEDSGDPSDRFFGKQGGLEVLRELRHGGFAEPVVMLTQYTRDLQLAMRSEPWRTLMQKVPICDKLDQSQSPIFELFKRIFPEQLKERQRAVEDLLLDELPDLKGVLDSIRKAAYSGKENVLLYGEPGVGKEALVDYYFLHSARLGRLVRVPGDGLIGEGGMVTLFGCEAGYPEPRQPGRAGAFETAGHGVLYIGDLGRAPHGADFPGYTAIAPLRPDHPASVTRLFGKTEIPVRCVTIASANTELVPESFLPAYLRGGQTTRERLSEALIGRFTRRIFVPPLRQRRADVEVIARHLLREQYKSDFSILPPEIASTELRPLLEHTLPNNWRDIYSWVQGQALPEVRRGQVVEEKPILPAAPPESTRTLSLTIRMSERGVARYSDYFGRMGLLKRLYWEWLVNVHGYEEVEQLRRATGMPVDEMRKQLENFNLPLLDDDGD